MTTVLIVDDSSIDQRIAAECVEKMGAQSEFAGDAQEALQVIEERLPDVLLTDLVMPGMSGMELVATIRERAPAVPIIVMTGKGSEQAAIDALKAGATSYISKANLLRDLEDTLRSVLAVVSSRQAREQIRGYLQGAEIQFILDYQPGATHALVGFVQSLLESVNFCSSSELMQTCTAVSEVVTNALEHGNLELDSALRCEPDNVYRKLAIERAGMEPYRSRRAYVTIRLEAEQVTFRVRDEGPGFDPGSLPDPTDPEFLTRPCGRGILLVQTFMDEVHFNDIGNEVTLIKRRRTPVESAAPC
ncbi:MAG: response regulator [Planctomycetota bacterium]|nr:MAG: response regulator [Planctomycetota bacterium]